MAQLTTRQKFANATLTITTVDGRPAQVDDFPIWASSDDTVLSVTVAADGMSAEVSSVAPGVARITITVDADLGDGVTQLTFVSEDVEVTFDERDRAANLTITLGEASEK